MAVTREPLPVLRVRRKPWNITRFVARFSDGVADVDAQREPWARHWDEHNADALDDTGPLWVALGDSSVQGVGASSPENGWVPHVLSLLREQDPTWRVLNLSMTGARMSHVVDDQIPLIADRKLDPVMVSCMIGTNDFIAGASASKIAADATRLADHLPAGTWLGRGGGPGKKRSAAFKQPLDDAQRSGQLRRFDPYRWPTRQGTLAADRFHPSDLGYRYIAENFWTAYSAESREG